MHAVRRRLLLSLLCGMLAVEPAAAATRAEEEHEVVRYMASINSKVAAKLAPLDREIATIRFPDMVSDAVFASPKAMAAALAHVRNARDLVAERRMLIRDQMIELRRETNFGGPVHPALKSYLEAAGRNLPLVIELDEARVELIERIDELLSWASQPAAPVKMRDNKVAGKTAADEKKYQALRQEVMAAMRVHDAALVQYRPVPADQAAAEAALKAAADKP